MSGTRLLLYLTFVGSCSATGITIGSGTRFCVTRRMIALFFLVLVLFSLLCLHD